MDNPLLTDQALPPFSELKNEHIEPALKQVIAENEMALEQRLAVKDLEPDWINLIQFLDNLEDRLNNLWNTVSHLFGVCNNPELRNIYDRCQPLVTEYATKLSQNPALYEQINRLAGKSKDLGLDESQRKVIDDYQLDFKLAGVDLDPADQERYKEVEKRLNQLSMQFSNNVLDATRGWTKQCDDKQVLCGLPESVLATAAEAASQQEKEGYLLTLDFPCYIAVMTYADDKALRQEIYRAFVTRASDQDEGNADWNNKTIIDELLKLRRDKAELLGYQTYTELSLAKKMAESPEIVLSFLNELVIRGKPVAEKEFSELKKFAAGLGNDDLEPWDVLYYSEKLRKQQYDVSQEELRPYFPVDKVKQGLFQIVHELYGIEVVSNDSYDTWHESVEAFDIYLDKDLIARFFLDLYTREGKRGGAWMAECRTRRQLDNGAVQIPAAYLVCNFSKGTEGRPPLLTHSEVTTLFHEFGHGLHHLLTAESSLRVSGINGVAWDAVELPSQLMENWCWDKQSINLISSHYETAEPLPDAMLEKMLAARNFQAGMKMMAQLEYALFDFELHHHLDQIDADYVRQTITGVRQRTEVSPKPAFNRFENSFGHIFGGGYAAGYYSYYWAEVLSADVFSRFEQAGVFDDVTGKSFLEKILSRGGAVKALELFRNFMGRDPDIAALLNQKGILKGVEG